jgi:rhodanese-related sulfurtransferase
MRRRLLSALLGAAAILLVGTGLGLLVDSLVGAGIPLVARQGPAGAPLSLDAAYAPYATGAATFVDARPDVAYTAGHVAGALSVPYGARARKLDALRRELPRTRSLIVYCDGGACPSATELGAWLGAEGWRDVRVLADGYPAWQAAGFPITLGATP